MMTLMYFSLYVRAQEQMQVFLIQLVDIPLVFIEASVKSSIYAFGY